MLDLDSLLHDPAPEFPEEFRECIRGTLTWNHAAQAWDVDGDVNLAQLGLAKIPVQFGQVTRSFFCNHNQLTSLLGAPQHVGGDFTCNYNRLTTLEGAPQHVGGDFYGHHNQLTSLEWAPQHVGVDFYCAYNQLPNDVTKPPGVQGEFYP